MKVITAGLVSVLLVLSAASAFSHSGNRVELKIIPDRGSTYLTIPFKEFREGTTTVIKRFLEARKGENYAIVIKNNTGDRIGIVIAVDGRNIISGKTSYLSNDERMYVVNPYGSVRLEGWRTDLSKVNRFYFTDEEDSYSVKTFGDSSAMGVIAAAVYREKKRPLKHHKSQEPEEDRFRAPAAPSGRSDSAFEGKSAGTGFGDDTYSPAVRVDFRPERMPFEKILVKYEWREVLCNKRIVHCGDRKNRLWDEYGFAPYPPDYANQ